MQRKKNTISSLKILKSYLNTAAISGEPMADLAGGGGV
jgi:hypothetical protein